MKYDPFTDHYQELLDGTYDCVDRIVLNGYFRLAQAPGGFRYWWRKLHGTDENLNDTMLMRYAGRFARRIRAYAEKAGIPLIECKRGERKHEIAERFLPTTKNFRGIFCILVGRAPAPILEIKRFGQGGLDIRKKKTMPYVNYYSFHIMDPEWGHLIIKLCPHPPFNAQIILNGHEYVEHKAMKRKIPFTKEGNCFTNVSDAAGLARVADTMRASSSEGRLVQVCERWIYSSCLCFALDIAEQEQSDFHYSYSVYQAEYSRNLLFKRGRKMEKVLNEVIDRTRAPLDLKTLKTIFGVKHRPTLRDKHGKSSRIEVVVERPVYNLTVFKIHFGALTVKMYSKGERVLRVEVIVHNARRLGCSYGIDKFPQIIEKLKTVLDRFLSVINGVDVSFIDDQKLDAWPQPSKVGHSRVGGLNVNQPRIRAVMEAVICLAPNPRGFSSSEVASKVQEILRISPSDYTPSQASYDLRKFRGKTLVSKIDASRRYDTTKDGLRTMNAFIVLRDKVLVPLLSSAGKLRTGPKPFSMTKVDTHYENIQIEMQHIFKHLSIRMVA